MDWWIWAGAGLLLLGIELLTPGFFVIFFGIGAFASAACAAAGLTNLPAQLGIFGVVSAASLILLRKRMVERFGTGADLQKSLGDIAGGIALAQDDIAPGAHGRAEYRGTQWAAKNVGAQVAKKGQRCRIEAVEGLTILIKPE